MNVFAQATLGPDAIAVADDKHADHQFRIHGRPTNLAIEGLQILPDTFEIDKDIDLPQQVIARDVVVEAKIVK